MKYITVLDFESRTIFQYTTRVYKNTDLYEDYLEAKGHTLANCCWMIHDDPTIIKNT